MGEACAELAGALGAKATLVAVAPFNEPLEEWWTPKNSQEGRGEAGPTVWWAGRKGGGLVDVACVCAVGIPPPPLPWA